MGTSKTTKPIASSTPVVPIVNAEPPAPQAPPAEQPKQEETPAKPTIEALLKERKSLDDIRALYPDEEIKVELKRLSIEAAAKFAEASNNDEISETDLDALNMASFKARDAVKQFNAKLEGEKAAKEQEKLLNEHLSIVDTFVTLFFNMTGVDEAKQKEITENEGYKSIRQKIEDELKVSFGKGKGTTIHIPAGMTGKGLKQALGTNGDKGEGKKDMYKRLLGEGKTVEEIMKLYPDSIDEKGGPNGTLRTAKTEFNKKA
jgi:hypothetical protein